MSNFIETEKFKLGTWYDMSLAPKGASEDSPCKEVWILGKNKAGQQRVIRWCMEYPCPEGCWMYAYEPTDYIDGIQEFYPIAWMPLPK